MLEDADFTIVQMVKSRIGTVELFLEQEPLVLINFAKAFIN
jgi:hypothetical protein